MRNWTKACAVLVLVVMSLAGSAAAQDVEGLDPLLKILIQNKVITVEQARSVQAEYDRQKAQEKAAIKQDVQQVAAAEVKNAPPAIPDALKGLKIGSTIFFSFQNYNAWSGVKDQSLSYSRFTLKRGYIDVQKEITPWLSARITPDIFADSTGQYDFRMKFAYAYFHWKGNDFFNAPYVSAGVTYTPWIEMEETFNRYRMVEATFLDRNSVWGSADLGVMGGSNIGPLMSEDYRKTVQEKFAGRYGSWAIGFYNGGGYTVSEKNQNKAFEWRLSIRPFGEYLKGLEGLQLQWAGVRGLGNLPQNNTVTPPHKAPDYNVNMYGVSYESKYVNASYMLYQGDGNAAGTLLDTTSHEAVLPAAPAKGYSCFIEAKLPTDRRFSAFFRYDHFDANTHQGDLHKKDNQNMTEVGMAWWMFKANALVLDYQAIDHTKPWTGQAAGHYESIPDDHRWQLTYQIKF